MHMRTGSLAAIIAAMLAAPGCQAVEPPQVTQDPVAELAVATLAADLGIAKDAIAVVSVTEVDWRNSSLGCPKPGMAYLDVITSGHKVTLRANGKLYYVHEADNRAFVCKLSSFTGAESKPELVYGRQLMSAQRDLAARLGVPVSEIRPGGAVPMTWSNEALGCPEPGKQYADARTEGWQLTLMHGDRAYTYHADEKHAIPCPAISAE